MSTLAISDPVAAAVATMFRKSFSQIPIYAGDEFSALLTTNTIARWLGARIADDLFSLSETRIAAVLEFAEDRENVCFLSRNSTIFDALERFQQWEQRGQRLEAILITGDGRPNQGLLGIITVHDLATITAIT